jgi:16S rRNA (uracil1498-N3)-methyltransferase
LPKGERTDWLVEKLTELGVTVLTPLQTRRSVVDPSIKKIERLRRIVIESSKQCGRNRLMQIEEPMPWGKFCSRVPVHWQRIVAHPTGNPWAVRLSGPTVVAIGPEGGFEDSEIDQGVASGWTCFRLGPRILRVETAAVACAALLALEVT